MKHTTFRQGEFYYRLSDSLKTLTNQIPNAPGVYLIYAYTKRKEELVYFGKAGMSRAGKIFLQGLQSRLRNTHHNVSRGKYFNDRIIAEGIDYLKIKWLVTYDHNNQINPCDVEDEFYRTVRAKWNLKRGRKKKA